VRVDRRGCGRGGVDCDGLGNDTERDAMKTLTRMIYQAGDGTEFNVRHQCERYEAELAAVAPIMARLPKNDLPHGKCKQHDREVLLQVKRDLFALVLAKMGREFPGWRKWNADDVHPMSIVGRVLDDYGGALAKAWSRLAFFNFDNGREYDQPFYANHPDKAELIP